MQATIQGAISKQNKQMTAVQALSSQTSQGAYTSRYERKVVSQNWYSAKDKNRLCKDVKLHLSHVVLLSISEARDRELC